MTRRLAFFLCPLSASLRRSSVAFYLRQDFGLFSHFFEASSSSLLDVAVPFLHAAFADFAPQSIIMDFLAGSSRHAQFFSVPFLSVCYFYDFFHASFALCVHIFINSFNIFLFNARLFFPRGAPVIRGAQRFLLDHPVSSAVAAPFGCFPSNGSFHVVADSPFFLATFLLFFFLGGRRRSSCLERSPFPDKLSFVAPPVPLKFAGIFHVISCAIIMLADRHWGLNFFDFSLIFARPGSLFFFCAPVSRLRKKPQSFSHSGKHCWRPPALAAPLFVSPTRRRPLFLLFDTTVGVHRSLSP